MLDDPFEDADEVAVDACILATQSAARIVAVVEVAVHAGSVTQDAYDCFHCVLALQCFLPCTCAP